MNSFFKTALIALPFATMASAQTPLTTYQSLTVGSSGTVTITGDGFTGWPSYQDSMGYVDPVTHQLDFVAYNYTGNHIVDTSSVTLNGLKAGSELELYLTNPYSNTFYTGSGSRNPDGFIHADATHNADGSSEVNFEDLLAPYSDWNYGDGHLKVTGVSITSTPTPTPFLAFGLGMVGFCFRRRRS